MKIITFEEHTTDKAIGAASAKTIAETFPNIKYMSDPSLSGTPLMSDLEDMGEERIADMDANGISMQVVSYSNQPQLIPAKEAIPLTHDANDRLAEAVKAHPDRFAAFAALPWADPDAAATELERTVTKLGFKGALITGRPAAENVFLDDKRYWPVLEMAAKLEVPLYIHPGFPCMEVQKAYYSGFSPLVDTTFSLYGWGWHAEAGIQLIRMMLAGVFDTYPNLQLIAGHWGEMVPFFLERLNFALPKSITKLERTLPEYFKSHIYVTPSGMYTYAQLRFIMDEIGVDRILYSVDYPYVKEQGAAAFLDNAPITQEEKEKIAHGNAEKLFKLKSL